jgi:NarL family two-component system response regulator LiaR
VKKQAIYYGLALGAIIALLKAVEYRYTIRDHSIEVYGGVLALIFTSLGIWLALKLSKPKVHTVVVEKEVFIQRDGFVFNEQAFQQTGISKRELEVLELMAKGLSNQEIAETLFVSLNTIKTHTSKVFEKLDVSRRTQAVQKAKDIGLIG